MSHPSSRLALPVLIAGLCMPLAALAAEPEKREAVIVVAGEASTAMAPDLAVVSLGVNKIEKTARDALTNNNAAMSAVLAALKEEGIADKDLQTSGFSIRPQYFYPVSSGADQKPPELTGFEVSNTLTVRVRDLSKLGAILDTSVTLGINQGGDIRFANADPDKALEAARGKAMQQAMAKARTLAEAAGVKLGRIIEISEASARPEPMPVMRMSMAKEAADAVPVASGENSYSVTVNVTFGIEQ